MFKQHSEKSTYDQIIDYIAIGVLVIGTSLMGLFLTMGASLTAAFMTVYKIHGETMEDSLTTTYWHHFKRTFWSANLTFLGVIGASVALYFLAVFAFAEQAAFLIVLFYIGVAYLVVFIQIAFAMIGIFKHKNPLHLIKNALLLIHIHPVVSFKLLINASVFYLLTVVAHWVLIPFALAIYFHLQGRFLKPTMDFYINRIQEHTGNTEESQ